MSDGITIDEKKIRHDIQDLGRRLLLYSSLTKKSFDEVVVRAGEKFGFEAYKELKKNSPAKGEIRSANEAAVHAGRGIRLSDAAKKYADRHTIATETRISTKKATRFMLKTRAGRLSKKNLNWMQLAVKRELGIRESARSFTGQSARFKNLKRKISGSGSNRIANYFNRTRKFLAEAAIHSTGDGTTLSFNWGDGESSKKAARSLTSSRNNPLLKRALANVSEDFMVHLRRKLGSNAQSAGLQ